MGTFLKICFHHKKYFSIKFKKTYPNSKTSKMIIPPTLPKVVRGWNSTYHTSGPRRDFCKQGGKRHLKDAGAGEDSFPLG